jgi:hypothetical protein
VQAQVVADHMRTSLVTDAVEMAVAASRVRTATDHITYAVTRRMKPGVHSQGSTSQAVVATIVHGTTYGMPFLLITQFPLALAVIVATHVVLDRYRAAKYVVWARDLLAPASRRVAWADVQKNQGSPVAVPSGLANALVIPAVVSGRHRWWVAEPGAW